jgi:hypothetical protein
MSMLIKIVVPMIDFLLNWYVRIVRLCLAVPAVIEMSLFATIFLVGSSFWYDHVVRPWLAIGVIITTFVIT